MLANLENSTVATGLEKVSFHSNPKERQCQRMFKLPNNCPHWSQYVRTKKFPPFFNERTSVSYISIVQRCGMWKGRTLVKKVEKKTKKFPGSFMIRSQHFQLCGPSSTTIRELLIISLKLHSVVKKRKRKQETELCHSSSWA